MASALAKAGAVGVGLLIVFGLPGAVLAYHQVPEGHIGVEKSWGEVTGQTHEPGANWRTPIAESIQNVEVRPRTYNDTVDVTTLNGTTFNVEYVVRYRVSSNRAAEFVRQWKTVEQAERRLIDPTVSDRLRREGAGIESSEVYTKSGRDRLTKAARKILETEFDGEAMVLESVQITNVGIPSQYQDALNSKEIAKQQVQKEQYNVKAEKQRARQEIVQAQADANATRIRANAIENNTIILKERYIDALSEGSVFVVPEGADTPIIMDSSTMNTTRNQTATDP